MNVLVEQIAQKCDIDHIMHMRVKKIRGGRIDPERVAIRLRALRAYTGLTQEQIVTVANGPKFRIGKGGKRVPSGSPSWAAYEAGNYLISVEGGDRLCEKFGITLDWIYRGSHIGMTYELSSALLRAELEVERTRKIDR